MQLTSDDIEPLGTRMLVRKYRKPEKIGSIYINPAWAVDNSRALWEVVKAGKCRCTKKRPNHCAECYLGMEIEEGTIVVTLPNRGVYACLWDEDEIFYLFAEEVMKWIPRDW
jgi:hypothetical protein